MRKILLALIATQLLFFGCSNIVKKTPNINEQTTASTVRQNIEVPEGFSFYNYKEVALELVNTNSKDVYSSFTVSDAANTDNILLEGMMLISEKWSTDFSVGENIKSVVLTISVDGEAPVEVTYSLETENKVSYNL